MYEDCVCVYASSAVALYCTAICSAHMHTNCHMFASVFASHVPHVCVCVCVVDVRNRSDSVYLSRCRY